MDRKGGDVPRIEMYSTQSCSYCRAAEKLLRDNGLPFHKIDLTGDDQARRTLMQRTGQRTVPQLFVDGEFVGGFRELSRWIADGRLSRTVGPAE